MGGDMTSYKCMEENTVGHLNMIRVGFLVSFCESVTLIGHPSIVYLVRAKLDCECQTLFSFNSKINISSMPRYNVYRFKTFQL